MMETNAICLFYKTRRSPSTMKKEVSGALLAELYSSTDISSEVQILTNLSGRRHQSSQLLIASVCIKLLHPLHPYRTVSCRHRPNSEYRPRGLTTLSRVEGCSHRCTSCKEQKCAMESHPANFLHLRSHRFG